MGCDIHLFVEKKNPSTGVWEVVKGRNPRIDLYRNLAKTSRERGELERAENFEKDALAIENGSELARSFKNLETNYPKEERANDYDLQEEYERELSDIDYNAPDTTEGWLYDGRSYNLFSILADVRNGVGFAGVDTGDGFIPISMPKGLPDNISDVVKKQADYWDADGHSHSYLTVKELLEYNWNQTTTQRGTVSLKEFKAFKEKGIPESYSGSVWGGNVVNITNIEMDMILTGSYPVDPDKSYYTVVSWEVSYHEAVGSFYTKSLETLKQLADGDTENTRIVFWFDN